MAGESLQWKLNPIEARVLGSLIEKAISTPEYYPLTLNALVNACNQKSNREPILGLEEDEVRQALHTLGDKGGDKGLASGAPLSGRVAKYEHRLPEVFNLGRREEALLCVLLLRGPQTAGELRARSDRLFAFEDSADVQSTLERLMRREPPLAKVMPRQPGTKEARYVHLLSGDVETIESPQLSTPQESASSSAVMVDVRVIQALEERLNELFDEVGELRQQVADLFGRFDAQAAPGSGTESAS